MAIELMQSVRTPDTAAKETTDAIIDALRAALIACKGKESSILKIEGSDSSSDLLARYSSRKDGIYYPSRRVELLAVGDSTAGYTRGKSAHNLVFGEAKVVRAGKIETCDVAVKRLTADKALIELAGYLALSHMDEVESVTPVGVVIHGNEGFLITFARNDFLSLDLYADWIMYKSYFHGEDGQSKLQEKLSTIGRLYALLHFNGFAHGDAQPKNIIESLQKIGVIDLEGGFALYGNQDTLYEKKILADLESLFMAFYSTHKEEGFEVFPQNVDGEVLWDMVSESIFTPYTDKLLELLENEQDVNKVEIWVAKLETISESFQKIVKNPYTRKMH